MSQKARNVLGQILLICQIGHAQEMIYRIGLMVTDELIKDAQYGKKLREGHHQPDQFHMIFSNGRYFYGLCEHLLF